MKHLTPLLFLFFSFSLFAQEGTTLEEYRYLSKGYLYQKELGLDITKNGYNVQTIFISSKGAKLIGLYKDGAPETKALLVVIEDTGLAPIYVCIPNKNSEERVLSLYNMDVQRLINTETRKMYDNAIQEFLYSALDSPDNLNQRRPTEKTTEIATKMITPNSSMNNEPVEEDILVSKGGVESMTTTTQPDPIARPPIEEEPAPNPIVTHASKTVHGEIHDRQIIVTPSAQIESKKQGTVSVKVCVNMDGFVVSAKYTQKGSSTIDKELKRVSVDAASKYRFGKSDKREQCGIIKFEY